MKPILPIFGLVLIVLGTIGFFATAILSFTVYAGLDHGSLPASSFLTVMIGIAFAFPSLLQDPASGGLSTMRIIVFAITLLFCTIYLKIGWSISKYEDLNIDPQWVYILGLAFGSKAFQSFSEKDDERKNSKKDEADLIERKEVYKAKGKDTSKDITNI
jgi:hypothetical protein